MRIRKGERDRKAGDIVYLDRGRGPKAEVIEKRDYTGPGTPWMPRRIFYLVRLLEDGRIFKKGEEHPIQAVLLLQERENNGHSETV